MGKISTAQIHNVNIWEEDFLTMKCKTEAQEFRARHIADNVNALNLNLYIINVH